MDYHFICLICHKNIQEKRNYYNHLNRHVLLGQQIDLANKCKVDLELANKNKIYKCSKCDKQFCSITGYSKHTNKYCKKDFDNPNVIINKLLNFDVSYLIKARDLINNKLKKINHPSILLIPSSLKLNPFLQEDLSTIDFNFDTETQSNDFLPLNDVIITMFEYIHYNPDNLPNWNIHISNLKGESFFFVYVSTENGWQRKGDIHFLRMEVYRIYQLLLSHLKKLNLTNILQYYESSYSKKLERQTARNMFFLGYNNNSLSSQIFKFFS
jgi:uncharacterized C2H2 Zn-finger protein